MRRNNADEPRSEQPTPARRSRQAARIGQSTHHVPRDESRDTASSAQRSSTDRQRRSQRSSQRSSSKTSIFLGNRSKELKTSKEAQRKTSALMSSCSA